MYIQPWNKKAKQFPSHYKKNDIQDIICDLGLVASGMHFVIPRDSKLQNHHQEFISLGYT